MEPTAPGFLIMRPCVNAGKLKVFRVEIEEDLICIKAVGKFIFLFNSKIRVSKTESVCRR